MADYTSNEHKLGLLIWKGKILLLNENETMWRLKGRAICVEKGDENIKYFHDYANHR